MKWKKEWLLTVFGLEVEEGGCGRHGASLLGLKDGSLVLSLLVIGPDVEKGSSLRYAGAGWSSLNFDACLEERTRSLHGRGHDVHRENL